MKIFYLITIVILVFSLLGTYFVVIFNSLKEKQIKKKQVESEIDDTLRTKYDILTRIKILFDKGLKGKEASSLDTLTKMDKIIEEDMTSFEFYRTLIDFENKILKLKENSKKMSNEKEYEFEIEKIEDINVKLSGEIKYYNDVVASYMKIYSRFPGNIVSKITRLKEERYFDNRDLYDDIEKDFKI